MARYVCFRLFFWNLENLNSIQFLSRTYRHPGNYLHIKQMWGRRCIASTRHAGVTTTEAIRCHPPIYRPLFPSSSVFSSSSSSSCLSTSSARFGTYSHSRYPGISSFRPLKLGLPISRVRYCSAETHVMAAKDRETLPDV